MEDTPLKLSRPPPPPDANKVNRKLKPIDNIGKYITFNYLSPLVRLIKRQKRMYQCDLHPVSEKLTAEYSSRMLCAQWNRAVSEHVATKKPQSSMLAQLFKANPQIYYLCVMVPLMSLCSISSPIALQGITAFLIPGSYYDCDQMFSANPTFAALDYNSGLSKTFANIYGYLIIIAISYFAKAFLDNSMFAIILRIACRGVNGMLDMVFQKMLKMSDQARQTSASGNITNLLYTDTMKISMMLAFLQNVVQIPFDLVAYIVYLGVNIAPIALCGLGAFLIFFPAIGIVLGSVLVLQRQIMNLKDLRVKRSTEVLNGIKIIKLFSLEKVQYARLENARKRELHTIFKFCVLMSIFSVVSAASGPTMTAIAFVAMTFTDVFSISNAFTTMFLFQFLSLAILTLPLQLTFISDAVISASRIATFLSLPDRDNGVCIRDEEKEQEDAIRCVGKPSFCWGLAKDLTQPQILDPFFKDNIKTLATMNKKLPSMVEKFKETLGTNTETQAPVEANISEIELSKEEEIQTLHKIADNEDFNKDLVDDWCTELDVPQISRLSSLEQYNFVKYMPQQDDTDFSKLKREALHILTMRTFIAKAAKKETTDAEPMIKNLDFAVRRGELVGICGQVGCGKTSLFLSLLGELRLVREQRAKLDSYSPEDGINYLHFFDQQENAAATDPEVPHVFVNGSVAYFSQQAHIFSDTVKKNILYGKDFDEEKYQNIIRMCCLADDFKLLLAGDETEIGEKGVTLSGGQKARVSLARALYSDADIYFLDDPLSAVDAHVGKTIWTEAILGYLRQRGKTVLIASHQTHFFVDADKVMQIVDGEVKHFGTLQQITDAGAKISGLTGLTRDVVQQIEQKPKVAQVDAKKEKEDKSGQITEDEAITDGNVTAKTYKTWIMAGSGIFLFFAILLLMASSAIQQYQTVLITTWTTDGYKWTGKTFNLTTLQYDVVNCQTNSLISSLQPLLCSTNATTRNKQIKVIIGKAKNPGNISFNLKATAFQQCVAQYGATFQFTMGSTSTNYLWLYIGCCGALIIFNFLGNMSFTAFSLSVARSLHQKILKALIYTNMRFFDTTPQGRIVNRLSKDTDSIDANILRYAAQAIGTVLQIIGMIITMAVVNWPVLAIIIPALIIFFLVYASFKKVYPDIKRIEAIMRSPVYSICMETLACLTTVRAYAKEKSTTLLFRDAADYSASAFMTQYGIIKWINFRLGMLTAAFALFVTLVCIFITPWNQDFAQYSGVIISQGFSIAYIIMQFVMTMVTFEGEMIAVERVKEYIDLPKEGEFERNEVEITENWPADNAGIEVKDLQFRYRPELDAVLNKICFKLKPKEHVGIVGRTGAGKSSITNAMYRLYEPDKGSEILVDGVNVMDLGLNNARRAFTIIPQDPFLFSGTLRQALCPYSQAEAEGVDPGNLRRLRDAEIWSTLEQVRMADYFKKQPGKLNAKIDTNGDNLSAGQKQLVCVARALLRKASCVILDEATAQVDKENDALIQETIRTAFANVTVLAIAHRLDTIVDFDRVIVMDKGNVAEFDTPANLLRARGIFYELVQRTGADSAAKLEKMAFQAEEQRKRGEQVRIDID